MSTGNRSRLEAGFVGTPVLTMSLETWQTMMSYIHACPVEVNGFGYVTQTGPLDFYVYNILILEQEASMASVNVSESVLHRHLLEMVREGRSTGDMRFQWHSHVNMEAYFSSTDTANIEAYARGWMLSLVANKRGEFEARLDVFEPFRVWSPLKVCVEIPPDVDLLAQAREDISQKVRSPGRLWSTRTRPDMSLSPLHSVDATLLEQ